MADYPKILAIGSPFGDDRLGWEVAKQLVKFLPNAISIETLDRPGVHLLSHFYDAANVLLIDAVQSDCSPGTIHWLTGDDIPKSSQPTSSHGIGVRDVFQLGKTLDILPEQIHLCGIERDPNWLETETLSPSTLKSLPDLISQIKAFLKITTC